MPSKVLYSLLPCLTKKEKDANGSYLLNGSILLEDLIASSDGKLTNPIRHYSADELIKATNNFHSSCLVLENALYNIFTGFLDNRLVIIKKEGRRDDSYCNFDQAKNEVIRDIIISMQMSTHKNVLKLLGCCLEFPIPALVLEHAGKGVLNAVGGLGVNDSLNWKTRLRVAKQLANAITYLHTAFPRPIIHRNLKHSCIFLDDEFVPKISDFSDSITIPPEQSHVEDLVKGTFGYLDPAYRKSGCITEQTDVYSFGVILLVFLTGLNASKQNQAAEKWESLVSYVKLHACDDQFQMIVDPKILEGLGGEDEQAQQKQLHEFLSLALLCTQDKSEARPDMIDVAKELVRIENSTFPPR
ncbi:putative protein kinase RLK-Pelle-RLCK-XII-2 family [Rosa chinensis]|uniref:Protein kinase domain-containing protein n=1 Tax=Rosa chinensis TaxID=74649 RepID=A0A2P6PK34_ROSCH|nr:non-functional pseudokinase ZED1 [Rosa chinensis]PRQ22282.1 putative protein kinase RLK-Pelle-RLCK-XII-2 family [Rosa chinensis]